MFFAPKEIKKETGESLVYNPHRTMVSKEFTFDAAHHLFNYEGKCKSLHGHTYHLQIAVSGYLDERGMTYDFGDLKRIYKDHLEPQLDHRYLNETSALYEYNCGKYGFLDFPDDESTSARGERTSFGICASL